jgi:hypothetical protein
MAPPLATTDQVAATASPNLLNAVNCCVPFIASTVGFGETESEGTGTVPGELTPCTSHDAVNSPANANTAMPRAIRARGASVCTMRLCMTLLIELLLNL